MLEGIGHEFGEVGDSGGNDGDLREDGSDPDIEAFHQLLDDAGQQLYPGCTSFSKLHFVVRLLHTKFLGGWSDKSFNILLELLNKALPGHSPLPKNFHEAKKMIKCLGLGYVNIHACENDCILFRKQYANADQCPICKTSRWKSEKKSLDGKRVHQVPRKVLRYFPIKKRLQRLFVSPKSATNCKWHDEEMD